MKKTTVDAARYRRLLFTGASVSVLTAASAISSHAFAQNDEIVVTAQKREESIQEVPLAITALSGDFTREVNLNDVKDLVTFTPGVTGNSQDSFIDTLSVRGILTNDFGVGGDPSVPIFKNGLYQGRNGAVVTSLYDLERAEILRGPQGFLFGRSAIGGAVSVITAKPVIGAVEGYVEIDGGSRSRIFGEGALNLPMGDDFAVRLALYGANENGHIDNVALPNAPRLGAQEKYAARFSALYNNDRVSALFTAEYEDREQSGTAYRATGLGDTFAVLNTLTGVAIGGNGRDIDSDLALGEADNAEILSFGLQIDVDFGGVTLTSLTGYKDHEYFYAEDFDGTPLGINAYSQDQEGQYFEQELRVVSNNEGPFNWYAGVSYYDEDIDADFAQQGDEEVFCSFYYFTYYGVNYFGSCMPYVYYAAAVPEGLLEQNQVRGRYHGWAAYVDATLEITDNFDVGVGVRYTEDTKEFSLNASPVTSALGPFFGLGFTTDGFTTDKQSWDGFTPRFVARYRPDDNWTLFASATRGFKSGGFGSFAITPDVPFGTPDVPAASVAPDSFEPETAWSYEAGAKGVLLDGRARVDGNVYYYTYRDLQVTVPGMGGGIIVDNVGRAKGWGVEGSIQTALGEYFDLLLNGAYADTELTGAEPLCDGTTACEGAALPQVPKFSGAAVLNFTAPMGDGAVKASAELFGQTETFGGLLRLPEARNGGYADLSIRAGYEADAGWGIVGYVENVTNELYYDGSAEGADILPAHFFGPSRPRTYGVRLSYDLSGG